MLDAFASAQNVIDVWGRPLTTAQKVALEVRLRQASNIIRTDVDGLVGGMTVDERRAADPLFAAVVSDVCRDMCHRLLLNPRGRRQINVDDSQVTLDQAISSGQLYLSDTEFRTLSGGRGGQAKGRGGKAFSIQIGNTPRLRDFPCL